MDGSRAAGRSGMRCDGGYCEPLELNVVNVFKRVRGC